MVLQYFCGKIKSLNSILYVRKFQEEESVLIKSKKVWKGDNSQSLWSNRKHELKPMTGNCCILAIPLKWRAKLPWRNSFFTLKCYHSESKASISHPLPEVMWILVAEEVTWDMDSGCMSIISHLQLLPQGIINRWRKIEPVPTVMGNRESNKDREIGIGFWGLIAVTWAVPAFFRLMDTPARFLCSHTEMSTTSASHTRCGCIFCACFLIFCKYLAVKLWDSQDV